jgi:membrane protein DedA with SNARE-associated domain
MKNGFIDICTAIVWAFGLIMLGRVLFEGYEEVNVILLVLGAICFIFGSVLVYLRFKALPGNMKYEKPGDDDYDTVLDVLYGDQCKQDGD